MKRREILKGLTLLPVAAGGIVTAVPFLSAASPQPVKRDFFKELGIKPIINAGATMTFLSGSLMLPEVLLAINSTRA